ncbi:transglycosylase SLT domain-containing protein [Lactiplantibacillus daowaiensis]|uniref:Transglycosylase SLT domain-containing protein n=1 Tax=Lactiplantibacillus daowaiensis TaxID=2559918 RepID=A0ABW1RYP0_9LACO|nr:transglycosylase SLT domain-containing protein [Lactiplantibacillus daowaiensis]
MKKFMRTILTTSAIATGLVFVGSVSANADTTTAPHGGTTYAARPSQHYGYHRLATTTGTSTAATNTGTSTSSSSTTATTSSTSTSSSSSSSTYTGSNLKSYVLSQMASRTGVSESTWNTIITRESNWEPYVVNSSSGAYGLFQNMHISSGSVEAQVDAAVSLYEAQGLSAWGY